MEILLGTSDFREVREKQLYYIDKTHFISELFRTNGKVLLIPRPRRFGKTLNLSMLHCFFDLNQHSGALFEGLAIHNDPDAMKHLNAYPTIFLSFRNTEALTWADAKRNLELLIAELVGRHIETALKAANPIQAQLLSDLHAATAERNRYPSALLLLTELLFKATGKKVVVLIDEYDKPILDGKAHGYFAEVTQFMRHFLSWALKDNPYLERAVITGILRIAKESIYSGLNNLTVYSIRDQEFSTCFGFTEAEVQQLLIDTQTLDNEAGVKAWYNGYSFGNGIVIYNPWSILSYISRATKKLCAYWINTADNLLIRDLIQSEAMISLVELETLLAGATVRKEIVEDIAFAELNPNTAWSLMLFTGYLTARTSASDGQADLAIPNLEVHRFFRQTVSAWLGGELVVEKLADNLLAEQYKLFAQGLAKAVVSILSYHDTGGKRPERAYHVFILGLLAHLQDRYRVESNRETGDGRADLCLIPRKPGKPGFVLEFKASKTKDTLEADASTALEQIKGQRYLTVLRDAGASKIVAIGLAFSAKRIALASMHYEPGGVQGSEIERFSAGIETEATMIEEQAADTVSGQLQERLILIGKIQASQMLKGLQVMDTEVLKNTDLAILNYMATALQS